LTGYTSNTSKATITKFVTKKAASTNKGMQHKTKKKTQSIK